MDAGTWEGINQTTGTIANTGMGLLKMNAEEQARKDTLAMQREQLQNTAAHQSAQLDIQRQQVQNETSKVPYHLRNYGTATNAIVTGTLKNFGVTDNNPIIQITRELAGNPSADNYTVYQALKEQYPLYRDQMREEIGNNFFKNTEKNPNYAQTPQGMKQKKLMDMLDQDTEGKIIDGAFAQTIQSKTQQDANTKAALLAAKPDVTTSDMKEWQFAVDNKQTNLTFPQWLEKANKDKRASTAINKITGTIAVNPSTGESEYLMSDGSFSGRKVGTKPATALDVSRVQKMIADGSDPLSVQAAADSIGYDYVPTTVPGKIYGTNEEWKLVKRESGNPK